MKTLISVGTGGHPIVSVLISLYNYKKYIENTLESVAQQTLKNIELIICNDCSTDGGEKIAISWIKKNKKRFCYASLIENDINSGLPATRNISISCAHAPYIFILDADNFIFPSCLEKHTATLQETGDDVAFAYSQRLVFNDQNPSDCSLENLPDWDIPLLSLGNYIDAMVMHKADILRQVGGYTIEPPFDRLGLEDYELWFKYMEAGFRGIKLHQPLIAYRVHQSSMLRTTTLHKESLIRQALKNRYPHYFNMN